MIKKISIKSVKLAAILATACAIQFGLCSAATGQLSSVRDSGSSLPESLDASTRGAGSFSQSLPLPRSQAVGGCDDSPENPTVVLAVLAAAVFGFMAPRRAKKTIEPNT